MWYVAQTAPGREQEAVEQCRRAIGREVAGMIFTPSYQYQKKYQGEWHLERTILFEGYVFLESEHPNRLEQSLKHIPGVVTPVRIGGGFYPIQEEEEIFLKQLLDGTDCIAVSTGYLLGRRLVIEQGPLRSWNGHTEFIRHIDRHKRIAELDIRLWNEVRRMKVGLEVKGKTEV